MRYIYFFLILAVTTSLKSQNSYEKYQNFRQTFDTIKVNNLTFNELYGTQLDEIFMDFKQINEALKIEIDSLNYQKNRLQQDINKINNQYHLFIYVAIAASSLLLVFIFIWIITLFKHGKTKKLYHQAQLEIGKLNAEIEKIKQNIELEKQQYNNSLANAQDESKKLMSISQRLQEENTALKQDNEKQNNEIKLLQEELSIVKSNLLQEQTKCEELSAYVNDLLEISKNTEVQNKKFSEQIAQFQQKESQYLQNIQTLNNQLEQIKQENEMLKVELKKALETEEKVNTELKNFIAELQAMLPLPKND